MADYPQDCIQYSVPEWWQADQNKTLCRGALIETYVQFYSQTPFELVAERLEAETHQQAHLKAQPLYTGGKRALSSSLPVAGLPRLEGAHCFIASRAKKRPCLVLGAVDQERVDSSLTRGMTKSSTHLFFLVAPFYSVEQSARSGYNPEFVERVMRGDYRSFFWDILPGSRGHESVLRLDQIQPVGLHHQSYNPLGYKLGEEAQCVMDEWLDWLIYNQPGENLSIYRELLRDSE